MEFKLDSQEDMAMALTQLYKTYGKTVSHIYLLKTILYEFKYDFNRNSVTEDKIIEKILEYQDIMSNENKLSNMFKRIFEKAEKNPADIVADSFAEFVLVSQADTKLKNIAKFHKKHKKIEDVIE